MSANGYSREVVERAIETLNGVIEIARNGQLMWGNYLSAFIVDEELAERGAICGGHRACFIGSLWLAAGVPIRDLGSGADLPHVWEFERRHAWRRRPHLKLALKAADRAAEKHAARLGLVVEGFNSAAEGLFERGLRNMTQHEIRDHVIKVCNNAKRAIRREYAEVLS